MAIILNDQEVRSLVDMRGMIDSIESMQKEFGNGHSTNLPRRKMIGHNGMLAVMGLSLIHI